MRIREGLPGGFWRMAVSSLGLACAMFSCRSAQNQRFAPRHTASERTENVSLAERPGPPPSRASTGAPTLRVATYNAGLAVGVLPHAAERAVPVAQALAALEADLVCVQEVWLDAHWQQLTAAVAPRLSQALRPAAARKALSRCSEREARPVLRCVQQHCGAISQQNLASCAVRECGHFVTTLSGSCTECLTRDPLRTLSKVASECAPAGLQASAAPLGSGSTYVYGGSYGIGMLTNADIVEEDFLRFESEQLARGALYARVRPRAGSADVHVFCTHLTADSRSVAYPARAGSWKSEHARQVQELRTWIERKAPGGSATVLLGDLNTGPALPDAEIRGRVPEQYASFEALGFSNPYLHGARAPACSFCSANIVNGGSARGGSLIDHILVRGPLRALDAERVLDQPLELDLGRERIQSHLSDHFGVAATLRISQVGD